MKKKTQIVAVRSLTDPIRESPGFEKKQLSEFKLDLVGLCEFGCKYCSSNRGNYLRINQKEFADATEKQLGERTFPSENPNLMFIWPEVLDNLKSQLSRKPKVWGAGQTLVYSMLTDGFSPRLVQSGVTEDALSQVLDQTSFRIRVLTKNAIVGTDKWCEFFRSHDDRFVVGLSVGTTDDRWAKRVEMFTPPPSSRLRALHQLQDAGVATYGMLCPIFPDLLEGDALEKLIDSIRPDLVEHVWAEPYNDRQNWKVVRDGYEKGSVGYSWLTDVYERKLKHLWSEYATQLYVRLRTKAKREGWDNKLRYLLYEGDITEKDAKHFRGFKGVLLQSKPAKDGKSRNPYIAAMQ